MLLETLDLYCRHTLSPPPLTNFTMHTIIIIIIQNYLPPPLHYLCHCLAHSFNIAATYLVDFLVYLNIGWDKAYLIHTMSYFYPTILINDPCYHILIAKRAPKL
jgi:hypothetical protein